MAGNKTNSIDPGNSLQSQIFTFLLGLVWFGLVATNYWEKHLIVLIPHWTSLAISEKNVLEDRSPYWWLNKCHQMFHKPRENTANFICYSYVTLILWRLSFRNDSMVCPTSQCRSALGYKNMKSVKHTYSLQWCVHTQESSGSSRVNQQHQPYSPPFNTHAIVLCCTLIKGTQSDTRMESQRQQWPCLLCCCNETHSDILSLHPVLNADGAFQTQLHTVLRCWSDHRHAGPLEMWRH